MDLGPHAVFIVTSYAFGGLLVGGLVLRAFLDHRAQSRALASLEARSGRSPRRGSPVQSRRPPRAGA